MTHTVINPPERLSDRLLQGHSRRARPRPPLEDHIPAAGGLRSHCRDMLRFLSACLEPPDAPQGPALALAQQPQFQVSKRFAIGLCWMITTRPRRPPVVWHNGGTWGFRSFAGFAPERGSAALVMSNSARTVNGLGFRLVERGVRQGDRR
jgi:CubicO group peptidase (beta-lactamase class C family)